MTTVATRPITVLELRDTHEIGGPGKTIIETFRALDPERFRSHLGVFLTPAETDDTPFIRATRECGVTTHVMRGANQYDPRLIWKLAQLIRSLDVDIVHAHEVKSDALAYLASAIRDVAIVTTLHGWIGNSAKQRGMIALDRRLVRRFDAVIAVSRRIRDDAEAAGISPDRLHLLHNAIVLERYRRTGDRGWLQARLGTPVPGPVVVSIGRLSPEKGHADLLDALALAANRGFPMSAVLVGDGPERPRLVEKARDLGLDGRVHLTGHLDGPQRALECADLTVLPSHTEGLPNAALEALAMEVPVLATRVGGTPEIIHDGETGRLVAARAPQEMAEALIEFATNPAAWQKMAARGRQLVTEQFDFRARTRALEHLYTRVMDRRS